MGDDLVFNMYKQCIFCSQPLLPSDREGDGEHIIPKNIFGFWRSYDVCAGCKQEFGRNVDDLGLQNVNILNAIHGLGLPDADKLYDRLPYVGEDTVDGRKVPMIRRKGEFRTKPNIQGTHFIECSESDWSTLAVPWLEAITRKRVSQKEFNQEIDCLRKKYEGLEAGESTSSDLLNYTIRKCKTRKPILNNSDLPSITRLIAKIAVCFLRYVIDPISIETISEIGILTRHARFGEKPRDLLINWCPLFGEVKYHCTHVLRLIVIDCIQIVDVMLFGNPNWRIVLGSTSPIILKDNTGRDLDEVLLAFDFENLEKREKHIGLKYKGCDSLEWGILNM